MSTIRVGKLTVSAAESGVSFTVEGEVGAACETLESRDVATVERFLAEQRSEESRTGFRVPVHALQAKLPEALHVSLLYQGTIYDALLVDLSLTGMLVRVPDLRIALRANVQARLILEEHLARIEAQVVRVDGSLLALHFTDSMRSGQLDPPADLGPIFARLEQIYLQARS